MLHSHLQTVTLLLASCLCLLHVAASPLLSDPNPTATATNLTATAPLPSGVGVPPNPFTLRHNNFWIYIHQGDPQYYSLYSNAASFIAYTTNHILQEMHATGRTPQTRVMAWSLVSPDRSMAFAVTGHPSRGWVTYEEVQAILFGLTLWLQLWAPITQVAPAYIEVVPPWGQGLRDLSRFGINVPTPMGDGGNATVVEGVELGAGETGVVGTSK